MIPFIEQIDPRIEAAARVFGADTWQLFRHVLLPLLVPGVLAALLLVLVRTIAMFELTFLTDGPTTPDAGGRALLRRVRRRRARRAVDRRDGGDLYGDDAGLAADRAALRQPDADRRPRATGAREMTRLSLNRSTACRRMSRGRAMTSRRRASASCISASAPFIAPIRPSMSTTGSRRARRIGRSAARACGRPRRRERSEPQDGLYALSVRSADGEALRVVGALRRLLVAPRATRRRCSPR